MRLRVGVSTHNAADIEDALRDEPDYIAIGPIFPTLSKDRPSPVLGLGALGDLASRVRDERPGLPIVAIGGISLETAREVGAVADCVAVIGALLPAEKGASDGAMLDARATREALDFVRSRARSLHAAILGSPP